MSSVPNEKPRALRILRVQQEGIGEECGLSEVGTMRMLAPMKPEEWRWGFSRVVGGIENE